MHKASGRFGVSSSNGTDLGKTLGDCARYGYYWVLNWVSVVAREDRLGEGKAMVAFCMA